MRVDTNNTLKIKNGGTVDLKEIPVHHYDEFYDEVIRLMVFPDFHCVAYYAITLKEELKFICCLADDANHDIHLLSFERGGKDVKLASLTAQIPAFHIFEREIWENHGVEFTDHPWLKPVRYPHDRHDINSVINDYPFYEIESHELHEVGVGPIHAGVIEPGHFQFTCHGEMVLHLEIQLGWQHRGVEKLFIEKTGLLQRCLLAESIAGDTAIGHCMAFSQGMESLYNVEVSDQLSIERSIALELERIAVHVGDISALCTDVAYLLGTNVFGALRTPIINYLQDWCGNRFGKALIRPGGTNYPLSDELKSQLVSMLDDFEKRFNEMAERAFSLPSVENRFDNIGTVTNAQANLIGSVGMAARMTGLKRDIRESHPFAGFRKIGYHQIYQPKGDVYARFLLRKQEITHSIEWIRNALSGVFEGPVNKPMDNHQNGLKKDSFVISLIEGWRGEICHCITTDKMGNIHHYKVKDPSMHNWKSLELSLRDLEISDFPINNKSYNLSYCGHDL